ncbi:MAG: phosphoenolpyruvate carboxylase [Inquilinus limosus]|uniref:Phosphoenolpyruvate carboxylase n=1 Tax=Inquilinus limosus TaxID=171674 RepID=A0A952FII1_9PROT|nr:phosphoenolpyruvate carboxylase [Inquilinus limosus]
MPDSRQATPRPEDRTIPLARELTQLLKRYEKSQREDPFANPIQHLALELSRRLADGKLDIRDVEGLIGHLTIEGFSHRAARLGRYLGETAPEANDAALRALFQGLTRDAKGGTVSFAAFRRRVESEAFGVVFTAHPTFNLSGALMADLAALTAGRAADGAPLTEAAKSALLDRAAAVEHRPDEDLSLAREHALSLDAIANARTALGRAWGILLDVAREAYPEDWRGLTPRLVTLASWVGYDLDGRSDIRWTDSLHKRLLVQAAQLDHYLAEVRAIRSAVPRGAADLLETLDLLESRVALAIAQIRDEVAAFAVADPGSAAGREQIRVISQRIHAGQALRLTESASLIAIVDRALERTEDPDLSRRFCLLRAELATHGLGAAHTHVRINATQVHNAIRKAVGMVSDPNDPRYRQSYLDRLNALLDAVEPMSVNFGSLLAERTSVKRLFMLLAQMLKYNDRSAPIRFLIAESESAFTCLTALYYARLFGVDGMVDISPLFETEKALENGSRIIEQLLENPHYRDYVRRRGRVCVQTGYSDAGRYLGQTPAGASIERLRLRLIRVIAKAGLPDVQLLIFDTHGESIGRGCHPGGIADRLSYVDPPATRAFMASQGVTFKQEVSFQGGDGYLYFAHPDLAYAVVARILQHVLTEVDDTRDDPFYDEASYIREFFTTVKEFQVRLMESRDYGVLLQALGPNLLFPSGSRATKRQHEDPGELDHAMPTQLRAIPHNAILMQLGLLANSVGGAGAAIAKDPERFRELYAASPRFRQLVGIITYGASASNPAAMKSYIDALDPGAWITRAAATGDRELADRMVALSGHLEPMPVCERQSRVFRALHKDFILLREGLESVAETAPHVDAASRDALAVLHAVRLALIQEIFLLAMRIPEFSSRHNLTLKQVIARVLHLDVLPAVQSLEEIFPLTEDTIAVADFGEAATYRSDESQNYQFENERIFRPMRQIYGLVRRVSAAVVHRTGFFG